MAKKSKLTRAERVKAKAEHRKKLNRELRLAPERPEGVPDLAETPGDRKRQIQQEIKVLFKKMADSLVLDVEKWIRKTATNDPDKAVSLFLGLAEFVLPKLARLEVDITKLSDSDLLEELERRDAEEKERNEKVVNLLPTSTETLQS